MRWTGKKIKDLRKRLGWTHSDLARRLACPTHTVERLEKDEIEASKEVEGQLSILRMNLTTYSSRLAKMPMADKELKNSQLEQISLHRIKRPE